ncbi:MAG TPA: right-handed parallel beta-helix repeat-containing protein [Telluria sp.]
MGLLRWTGLLAILGLAGVGAGVLFLQSQGVTPRALAPYVEKRSAGHNGIVVGIGHWLGGSLRKLDRGDAEPYMLQAFTAGAQPVAAGSSPGAENVRLVASVQDLRAAFAAALPGSAITLLPGTYRIRGKVDAVRAGTASAPVRVRAVLPQTVFIEFEATEGFLVAAPHWQFENLTIRGVCAQPGNCEHAFHVVGAGHHFVARNNTILDFNAHIKINGDGAAFPDHGLIEGNTLSNDAPRRTVNPVTPIDLVAASDWTIRGNLIRDFIKVDGDRISYGAFAKGAGARTLFERNMVLCEQRFQGLPGQRVGLSFGGGATGKPFCRDRKCITEQDGGVMRANLIAACSDAGIYLNSAAASQIADNTLLDTGGIEVRFPESSAALDGNLVDGAIRSRNGGVLKLHDNLSSPIAYAYAGYHPVRQLLRAPLQADYGWRGEAPRRGAPATAGLDLCGSVRPAAPAYGAFEDFRPCMRP